MVNLQNAPESLLAIDVGSVHTRAMLFDVAEDRYHFVAQGKSLSTAGAPFHDVSEGVRLAVEELQKITGRIMIGKDERLILPGQPDGSGVDALVSTLSAGPAVSIVATGLLNEVSLESAQRLAGSTYARLADCIGLNDRRNTEMQIDAIIQARPDVVIIAGGVEHGATRSIAKIIEVVGLACYLLPANRRPVVLYAGNQAMSEKVKAQIEAMATVRLAPNIRPAFDHEDLGPAQTCLAELVQKARAARVGGVADLITISNGHSFPTATAFGRMIRFLSKVYDPGKGVLGVDLGANSTVLAAAFSGKLTLSVQSGLGMGAGLTGLLDDLDPAEITRWLATPVTPDDLENYLRTKIAFPASLPVTAEEQAMEQAAARAVIRQALRRLPANPAGTVITRGEGLVAPFEPIVATGSVLASAPTPGQAAMILLDALQPAGVTTLVLDPNNLTAALGAAAGVNSVLPVQILESGAYQNLGTVISPVSSAPLGAPILHARMVYADRDETETEVSQGALQVLPLARGQTAQLFMEPIGRTDVGLGRSSRGIKVTGGILGTIIDARGRPLRLPADLGQRNETIKKWLWALGG
jgi:uncharacterized protein (TIGR01319 family)